MSDREQWELLTKLRNVSMIHCMKADEIASYDKYHKQVQIACEIRLNCLRRLCTLTGISIEEPLMSQCTFEVRKKVFLNTLSCPFYLSLNNNRARNCCVLL